MMPHDTRKRFVRALKSLTTKQLQNPWKKHDNIPMENYGPRKLIEIARVPPSDAT